MNQIYPYKNREIDSEKPVKVYRNLNKKGVWWSVKQGSHVVAHATQLTLFGCECVINKKGQERARKEGVRNVHAYVDGYISDLGISNLRKVRYNPYKDDTFIKIEGVKEVPIKTQTFFQFDQNGAWCAADILDAIWL